jgi:HK97 family phage prohead protease
MDDLSTRAGSRDSVESRARPFDGAELREDSGGKSLTFTGYASVFDHRYSVWDMFGEFKEQVKPGAFRNSLAQGADVPFKINHDGMTLARTKSGTMRLAEDTHGLHVEARLDPANPQVQALRSAMERGDIDEMSFAFRVTEDNWSDDYLDRSIYGADIHKGDVSAVNYGANPATSGATLRSADIFRALHTLRTSEGLSPEDVEALKAAVLSLSSDPAPEPDDSEADEPRSLLSPLYAVRARLAHL